MKPDTQFDAINRFYGLSIRKGQRVVYSGGTLPERGVVKRADKASMHVHVLLDGYYHILKLHPTWMMEYVD